MSNAQNLIRPVLQRVYVKDISFEAPNVLKSVNKDWKPDLKLDLNTRVNRVEEKIFEVVLAITATVKSGGETAYICEVQQAGIFTVNATTDDELKKALGCDCPTMLFPFGREVVSDLVARGGFPSLLLVPVNFEQLYAQALAEQHSAATATKH